MLVELRIENFGIIDQLRFRPGLGLNAVTGETGSGKSLLLGALDLVLGGRAGSGMVRAGASRALIEAIFDISRNDEARSWLAANGFPLGDGHLQLRRELPLEGKPRPLINGKSASLTALRSLAASLVELHGQHDQQRLLDADSHIDALDQFAVLMPQRDSVGRLYEEYSSLRRRLQGLLTEKGQRRERAEFLRFALQEIDSFEPNVAEFEQLEQEISLIRHSGKLFHDLHGLYLSLREDEGSALDRLYSAQLTLESALAYNPRLEPLLQLLRDSLYAAESAVDQLRSERERLHFSPERLEEIEERLAGYRRLQKKYGDGSTASLIATRDRFMHELSTIEMSDEELDGLRSRLHLAEQSLREQAEDLSLRRRAVIPQLEERVAAELAQLGMSGGRIHISLQRELDTRSRPASIPAADGGERESESGESGAGPKGRRHRYLCNEKGLDRVEFLLQANPGEAAQPLRRVASGGELSRILLALKSIFIDAKPLPLIVFDEIDAGVGGEVAHTLGDRLAAMALQSQLLVVTHLHQIASLADQQYRISKRVDRERTVASLEWLHGEDRLQELARMLGGEAAGPVVLEHARELLARRGA